MTAWIVLTLAALWAGAQNALAGGVFKVELGPLQLQNVTLSSSNGFLNPNYKAQLTAANQTTYFA